jgi:glucose/arabinose dehydrogenase
MNHRADIAVGLLHTLTWRSAYRKSRWLFVFLLFYCPACTVGPTLLKPDQQVTIDRKNVEFPSTTELKPFITGLTAPTSMVFDSDGNLLIAEGGYDGNIPRIFGFRPNGTYFDIYPQGRQLPDLPFNVTIPLTPKPFRMSGPIGGIAAARGKVYVSHRDDQDRGMITAFGYDGSHTTIVADLPAQGDYSVTDIAIHPINGRIYFGVGAATNSGVVGLDNMTWLQRHRDVCDIPSNDIYLLGRRFDTVNPFAGILGGSDIAVTAPFQRFGKSIETRIPRAANNKPNAAIYSADANGGDLRVMADGIRYPAGINFSDTSTLYATSQGMKLRGTRPVKDDPDVMLRMVHGTWYGWPDFGANLVPIRDGRFQPPVAMIEKSGYRDLSFLIDHQTSQLKPPPLNSNLVSAEFKPLSGAAKFDFAPGSGSFSRLRQAGNIAIVALFGDRAPYDTSGMKMTGPTGYKVVQVNLDDGTIKDFIRNTQEGPASLRRTAGLERPVDVKFGPDGALYILDFGQMEMDKGREKIKRGTGCIFKLIALPEK